MYITSSNKAKWWHIRQAGISNASAIAKVLAKENKLFQHYRWAFNRLHKYELEHGSLTTGCKITHNMLVDMMLEDTKRHFGTSIHEIAEEYITRYNISI